MDKRFDMCIVLMKNPKRLEENDEKNHREDVMKEKTA